MKRKLLVLLLFLSLNLFSQRSDDFDIKYNKLMENLSSENWLEANKICKDILDEISLNSEMEKENSVLKYILIYTNAGLLNNKIISKEEAFKRVEFLIGSYLSMPAHPFRDNCYVNCTNLAEDKENTFFSGVNNSKGTQIFSFEYVSMKESLDKKAIEKLKNKNIALSGFLKEIKVEGNFLPRYKLILDEGIYEIIE